MPRLKKTAKQQTRQTGSKMLDCMFCRTPTRCDAETSAILCGGCVAKLTDAPAPVKPSVSPQERYAQKEQRKLERAQRKQEATARKSNAVKGRGRGWHLRKVFEWEGQFYSFGELITPARARELMKA